MNKKTLLQDDVRWGKYVSEKESGAYDVQRAMCISRMIVQGA